jgi:hypothetical protein
MKETTRAEFGGHPDPRARRAARVLGSLGGGLFVLGWLVDDWLIHAGAWGRVAFTDAPIYFDFVSKALAGRVPYRDFAVGYPPFAWPAFLAPAILPAARHKPAVYAVALSVVMAILGTVLAILAVRLGLALGLARRRTLTAAVAVGATPALLGVVAPGHFDLWPATLLCAALWLHLAARRRTSAVVLGLAAAAKIYPAVIAPLLVIDVLRGEGRRSAAAWCAAFAAGATVPFLVLAPWAWRGLLDPLTAQAARPLQVESLGAAVMFVGHWAAGLPVHVVRSFGSDNLAGELADVLGQDLHGLWLLGLAWTWVWYARVGAEARQLARAAALALSITVAAGSTLSPQYMLWLVPAAFLAPGRRGIAAMLVAIVAFALTSAFFPTRYADLVEMRSAQPAWILLSRNLAVVALVGVLAVPRGWPRVNWRLVRP